MNRYEWVAVSGFFNPVHAGHIALFNEAKLYGINLLVIVNNDYQVSLKQSIPFYSVAERMLILDQFNQIDKVVISIDQDESVCKTLSFYRPNAFLNSGDVNIANCREKEVCDKLGIKLVFGARNKIGSSSEIIDRAIQYSRLIKK